MKVEYRVICPHCSRVHMSNATVCGCGRFLTGVPATKFTDGVPEGGVAAAASPAHAPAARPALCCGQCGARRDEFSVHFCRACGAPFDVAAPVRDPASPEARLLAPRAGFWRRTGAYVLDSLILLLVGVVGGLAAAMPNREPRAVLNLAWDVVALAYFLNSGPSTARVRRSGCASSASGSSAPTAIT